MIKALIFDVDGTLLDSFEANFELFKNLMDKAGYPIPTKEQYTTLFHRTLRDTIQMLIGSDDDKEIQRVCNLLDAVSAPAPVFNAGVADTIKILSEHYLLGVVTSRVKAYAYEPPLNTLEHYFKATVAYEDTENHKPHPEPLLLITKQLQVLPEECVYVGDAKTDIEAGHAAGMRCILYSQEKTVDADAVTADFSEIPILITKL
jgi:pyrophosphatase PpaX